MGGKRSPEDNRKQDLTRTCTQSGVKIEQCSRCPLDETQPHSQSGTSEIGSPSCRRRSTPYNGKRWRSAPAPADCRPRSCWVFGSRRGARARPDGASARYCSGAQRSDHRGTGPAVGVRSFRNNPDQPAGRLSAERGGQNAAALALLLGIRARPSRGCACSGSGGLSVANRIADMEVQQRTSAEPLGTLRHQVRAARA